ncbi:hypothetical protein [Cystobacter fuscus]|uniref:hypothetical protein n=1 Tax=Cystobacter fuscus TaxID=43 RepID=UPI002B2B908D|nr:hypothetical protein F0U63_28955 [Cystobacter fuscus]
MTSKSLVLLSQAEQPAPSIAGAAPPLADSTAGRWRYLLQRYLSLSLGAEVFDWSRVDVDGRLAAQLAHRTVEVALGGLAQGLGQPEARHLYSGQVRWHFSGALYALAEGGTLLYLRADGVQRPDAYASLGLGVDHAR